MKILSVKICNEKVPICNAKHLPLTKSAVINVCEKSYPLKRTHEGGGW